VLLLDVIEHMVSPEAFPDDLSNQALSGRTGNVAFVVTSHVDDGAVQLWRTRYSGYYPHSLVYLLVLVEAAGTVRLCERRDQGGPRSLSLWGWRWLAGPRPSEIEFVPDSHKC
jgi:hypothetical protein